MKRIRFMTPALALASCLSGPLSTNAQEEARPRPAEGITSAVPEATTGDYTLGTPEGLPMEEAVRDLHDQADAAGLPMPNLILDKAAGAEFRSHPSERSAAARILLIPSRNFAKRNSVVGINADFFINHVMRSH